MAGLLGYRAAGDGLRQNLAALQARMDQTLDNAMLDAGIAAKEAMVFTIWHTPSSLRPGKPNRVWTSRMLQGVSEPRVNRRGQTRTLAAGWLEDKADYFDLQEHGGTGPGGINIAPMNMLVAGWEAAKAVIDAEIRAEKVRTT